MEKATLAFRIYKYPKTWQILKRFIGTFHWAQTLNLRGVASGGMYILWKKAPVIGRILRTIYVGHVMSEECNENTNIVIRFYVSALYWIFRFWSEKIVIFYTVMMRKVV